MKPAEFRLLQTLQGSQARGRAALFSAIAGGCRLDAGLKRVSGKWHCGSLNQEEKLQAGVFVEELSQIEPSPTGLDFVPVLEESGYAQHDDVPFSQDSAGLPSLAHAGLWSPNLY